MNRFLWTCCDGEFFIRFPLLGLVHMPLSLEQAQRSLMFPVICFLYLLLLALVSFAVAMIPRKIVQRKLPFYAVAPIAAYLAIFAVLSTSLGDYFIEVFIRNKSLGASILEESVPRVQRWSQHPSTSPIARLGSRPVGNLTVWNEEDAHRIAEKVVKLRETRWTFAAEAAHGSPLMVLGAKYAGSTQGGAWRESNTQSAFELWDIFDDEWEDLRDFIQFTMWEPAYLVRNMWPPAIIVHLPNLPATRESAHEIHQDAFIPSWTQDIVLDSARNVVGDSAYCEWDHQMTVLINLRVPKTGAAVRFWDLPNSSESPQEWQSFDIPHQPGKAVFIECRRPHAIVPFKEPESLVERMCIHAYMIPCRAQNRDDRHWQILGVIGR